MLQLWSVDADRIPGTQTTAFTLSLPLHLCLCLSASLCLCLCLPVYLSLSASLYLCLCLPLALALSLPLLYCLFLSVSLALKGTQDLNIYSHADSLILSHALIVVQILTGENWNDVLYNAIQTTSYWVALPYFFFCALFSQFIVLNIMVAILLLHMELGNPPKNQWLHHLPGCCFKDEKKKAINEKRIKNLERKQEQLSRTLSAEFGRQSDLRKVSPII